MSERFKFTKTGLSALETRGRRYQVFDDDKKHLMLRVGSTGVKTFYYSRKVKGRFERVKIGRFPEITVDTARKRSDFFNNEVAHGRSPSQIIREEKVEAQRGVTLAEVWGAYLEKVKTTKKSWQNEKWQFDKHLSNWNVRELGSVSRDDVNNMLGRIKRNSGPVAANRVRALLCGIWNWWSDSHEEFDVLNPCSNAKRFKENARDRYLFENELKRFWIALNADLYTDPRDAIKLLLLTGQRKSTICGLAWSEVDFKDNVLRIPASRMKADRAHFVPLVEETRAILTSRRKECPKKEKWVFPTDSNAGHLVDLRAPMRRILKAAEIDVPVTPHDLRRTWATYCRELGRDSGPVLGHMPQGVTKRHYEQISLKSMRAAMEATVDRLIELATVPDKEEAKVDEAVEAGKVLAFPGANA